MKPTKLEEHIRFIDYNFAKLLPDDNDETWLEERANELLPHHKTGLSDCRIVAEVEWHGGVPLIVTFDGGLKNDFTDYARIQIATPIECWAGSALPRGTPANWVPASAHPLANETWWRWGIKPLDLFIDLRGTSPRMSDRVRVSEHGQHRAPPVNNGKRSARSLLGLVTQ